MMYGNTGAPVNDEARKRNGNLPGMGGVFNTVNLHLYHYAGNNPVKYTDPTGRTIVIGISMARNKNGGESKDLIGQHAFIMYIDNYFPEEDSLMLDASGQFGNGRASDIVGSDQIEISVEKYLEWFEGTPEELITFTINMSDSDEQKIKELINNVEGRGFANCAIEASSLLKESGLFPEVEKTRRTPKGLLNDMYEYAENHENVKVERYDFQTQEKIEE